MRSPSLLCNTTLPVTMETVYRGPRLTPPTHTNQPINHLLATTIAAVAATPVAVTTGGPARSHCSSKAKDTPTDPRDPSEKI